MSFSALFDKTTIDSSLWATHLTSPFDAKIRTVQRVDVSALMDMVIPAPLRFGVLRTSVNVWTFYGGCSDFCSEFRYFHHAEAAQVTPIQRKSMQRVAVSRILSAASLGAAQQSKWDVLRCSGHGGLLKLLLKLWRAS